MTTTGTSRHGIPRQPRSPRRKPDQRPPVPRGHLGWIVAGSLTFGVLAALLLVAVPLIPADPSELTGAVLCGFAAGWALLAVMSARRTDQPQRWAWVPAAFMGAGGVLLIIFGAAAEEILRWVWPPVALVLAGWMLLRVRRDMGSRFGRWLLYPLIVVLAVVSVAGGFETVRAASAPEPEVPGQLVDVGGHRLHLQCTGSGSPTVVLEPGAGLMSATTGWIAPAVAGQTRVCVYDRAGRGGSERADTSQDGRQVATDLHTLLRRGNVPGPYVLAGHSFGGLYVQAFAAQYPDEVAGMVLIDSTAPASTPDPPPPPTEADDMVGRASALLSSTAQLGVARLLADSDYGTLPPDSRDAARASGATIDTMRGTLEEYLRAGASAKEAAALTSFDDKPLVVLTAGVGSAEGWMADQDELAALSTNSVHRVVDGAAHADLLLEERPAAAVSQAILDVVDSLRNQQPLED